MYQELGRAAEEEEAGDRVPTHPCGPDESRAAGADPRSPILTLPGATASTPHKWPKINSVWRMEMSLWPTGESFSEIGFKLHYTSNFMGT